MPNDPSRTFWLIVLLAFIAFIFFADRRQKAREQVESKQAESKREIRNKSIEYFLEKRSDFRSRMRHYSVVPDVPSHVNAYKFLYLDALVQDKLSRFSDTDTQAARIRAAFIDYMSSLSGYLGWTDTWELKGETRVQFERDVDLLERSQDNLVFLLGGDCAIVLQRASEAGFSRFNRNGTPTDGLDLRLPPIVPLST
jgi:hypothetical protein